VNAAGVYALLADPALDAPLAAGFEEEGVPLAHAEGAADALQLAREAARRSALGIGIGGDGERLILLLGAAPRRPYLEAAPGEARRFGQQAARLAARRPLYRDEGG
jgi:hypothetical protein